MKIIQPTYFNFPTKTPQIVNYRKNNNENDVFVLSRSVNSPSFQANLQNIYKKILDNPTLSKKFMGLVSAAAASLIACAHFGNEENNEVIDLQNFLRETAKEEVKDNLVQLEKELEECKEENLKLKQKIEELEGQINISASSTSEHDTDFTVPKENTTSEAKQNVYCNFEFPKKWGKLSGLQQKLKEATINLTLSEISSERLTFICQQALQKGVLDDNQVAEFTEKLSAEENKDLIIETFYEALMNLPPVADGDFAQENNSNLEVNSECEEIPKETGLKIVGKIDVNQLQTKVKDDVSLVLINPDDQNKSIFEFKAYSANHQNMSRIISNLISRFQKQVYTQYKLKEISNATNDIDIKSPKWKYNQKIPAHVLPEDVTREFEKVNAANKTYGSSKYLNISKFSPEEIADIINSDDRFRELFTMHGALRFLDRYVDFNSDVDFEIQSILILDELYKVIQKSINAGVQIDSYVSEGYYAPKMNISSETFDEKSRKIFGDRDLYLTFAEAQATSRYVPSHNKNGLICTIYSR